VKSIAPGVVFLCRKTTGWWLKNHLEKYDFVNGKDDIPYMKWKIQKMFETTNQRNI
jgi:hypothetical protein